MICWQWNRNKTPVNCPYSVWKPQLLKTIHYFFKIAPICGPSYNCGSNFQQRLCNSPYCSECSCFSYTKATTYRPKTAETQRYIINRFRSIPTYRNRELQNTITPIIIVLFPPSNVDLVGLWGYLFYP